MCHFSNTNSVSYNLRKGSRLFIPLAKSVDFVRKLRTFRRSLLLNDLPLKLKNSQTIKDFEFELKNLGKIHCTCTMCRLFLYFHSL